MKKTYKDSLRNKIAGYLKENAVNYVSGLAFTSGSYYAFAKYGKMFHEAAKAVDEKRS